MPRRRSLVMNLTEMLQRIGESLGSTATAISVLGEPIHAEGKPVVPVGKVAHGFGAGGGSGNRGPGESGGGGGGVRALPTVALEITPENTRFIPFTDARPLALPSLL